MDGSFRGVIGRPLEPVRGMFSRPTFNRFPPTRDYFRFPAGISPE